MTAVCLRHAAIGMGRMAAFGVLSGAEPVKSLVILVLASAAGARPAVTPQ